MHDTHFPEYERIKAKLLKIGVAIPGTIRETHLKCGKAACACATSDDDRHGPYYFWNRRIDGKLTSKSIPEDKLRLLQGWIENRYLLEALMQEMLDFGLKIASQLPDEPAEKNSKQRASAKRGK